MKGLLAKSLFFISFGMAYLNAANANVYVPIDSSYKLTFADEFNGTSVDTSKWNKNWFGSSQTTITKPVNSYETGAYDPSLCTVANGFLQMTAIQKSVTDQFGKTWSYSTCHLNTMKKFEQPYGYAEARMYLPSGGAGKIANWPGFWANGDHSKCGGWPCAGEHDIMEGLSGYAQWHFHGPNNFHPGGGPRTDYSGWHIFAALWEPGKITYYYDGINVGSVSSSNVTSAPMAYLLQNAVSPENKYGGPMLIPATVLVDYVHVYSKDPSSVAITPEPNYGGPGDTGTSVVVDNQAPTTPTQLNGQALSSSQIKITGAASTDNVAVAGYFIFRNGLKVATINSTFSFTDSALEANTTYSYQASAFDSAGNVSALSSSINVTTLGNTVEPPPMVSSMLLDFGNGSSDPGTSPVATGYKGVAIQSYSIARGFGWRSIAGVDSRDRSGNADPISRDFHKTYDNHFLVDLANGSYKVTLKLGDSDSSLSRMAIDAEGSNVAEDLSTSSTSRHLSKSFVVDIVDGQLDLRLYTTHSTSNYYGYVAINSLEIVPTTETPVIPNEPTPENLAVNASFENGNSGWSLSGSVSAQSIDAKEGIASLGLFGGGSYASQVVKNLKPGTNYVLTGFLKSSSGQVSLGVNSFGSNQIAYATNRSEYVKIDIRFRTGSSNTSAKIFIYCNSNNGRADQVSLTEVP